jgi:hypothetical protein
MDVKRAIAPIHPIEYVSLPVVSYVQARYVVGIILRLLSRLRDDERCHNGDRSLCHKVSEIILPNVRVHTPLPATASVETEVKP